MLYPFRLTRNCPFHRAGSIHSSSSTLNIRQFHRHRWSAFNTRLHGWRGAHHRSYLGINAPRNIHPTTNLIPSFTHCSRKSRIPLTIDPPLKIDRPKRLSHRHRTIKRRIDKHLLSKLARVHHPPIGSHPVRHPIGHRPIHPGHRQRPRQKINRHGRSHPYPCRTTHRYRRDDRNAPTERSHFTHPLKTSLEPHFVTLVTKI